MTQKIFNFVLTTLLMTQHFSYAASNSIANDILSPNSTAYDFTFTDDANSSIYLNKTYIKVSQVVKEIEKIANALVPRDINVANCSTTGCPIDAVQCDAVTELPSCPDGSVLNTTRDMCQKDPDVFSCPTGFTYDSDLRQCVKPLDCPSGGTYSIERNRCEFKRIYECPAGYTQDGNVCVAPPMCPSGAISDASILKCTVDATYACADAGWTFNATTQFCEKNPVCIIGTYSNTYDKCLLSYTPTCASGYTYNSSTSRCEKIPDCPVGTTYNATTNRCEQGAGSACTLAGGTWNGTNCTVNGSYAATGTAYCSAGCKYLGSAIRTGASRSGVLSVGGSVTKMTTKVICQADCSLWVGDTRGVLKGIAAPGRSIYVSSLNDYSWYSVLNQSAQPTTTYTCPSGGTLSGTTCNTTSNVAASCPVGYTHDGSGRCYANPTCPSSGTFDGNADKCWLAFSKSCTSGIYDSTSNACINEPICDGGTLNIVLDKCQMARDIVCSIGVKDPVSGKCTFTATCQTGAILDTKGCTQEAIPLTCPSGIDTVLDVCYSNQDACKIDASYPNLATLTYSDALNICIVDENVVCAPSLTWSELYKKCEAVPICYNGMYNPENDFCYISTKECPTNAAYPCTGPIGNQWCSPYSCNPTTNQCGIAECPGGIQPSSTAEMSPSYNANLVYNVADALCINSRCDLANSSRFTYCGLEEACPSGFGVFEQNGQCFVRECPQGSFQENNTCYTLGCPKGTTEQGNGTCLVN